LAKAKNIFLAVSLHGLKPACHRERYAPAGRAVAIRPWQLKAVAIKDRGNQRRKSTLTVTDY
jgi:hypothetical protein